MAAHQSYTLKIVCLELAECSTSCMALATGKSGLGFRVSPEPWIFDAWQEQ